MSHRRRSLFASASLSLATLAFTLIPTLTAANPQGGQVVAGQAAISTPSSSTVIVTETTNKAIINWNAFNIAPGETTRFNQPSASSIILNRVVGGDPSEILGNLLANGQVWLINPNGIAFGKTARVDVAGLLATTLDITNQNFLAGNYVFAGRPGPGHTVTNAGQITISDAGLAALVAPGVANSGVIEARLGQIQLSSANGFTIDFAGDGTFNFLLTGQVADALAKSETTPAGVSNSGSLIADGGTVFITANAAKSVVDQSINMDGYIQARTVGTKGGVVTLDGGSGTVQVSGDIDASGVTAGDHGGTISITGTDVALTSTAVVNASGNAGGGDIDIGGDLHGAGPLANAGTTEVDQGAQISADALSSGDGGKVVIWSNNQTTFAGSISARGGTSSGDGGSAEVSSHQLLDFTGTVDMRAPAGATGSLLLDPENVTIAATGDTPALPGSAAAITLNPTADDSIIQASTLEQALGLADVTITTGSTGSQAGDITVATNVDWSSGNSLTLSANRNVVIDDGVTIANTGAGSLVLQADSTGSGTGTVEFDGSGTVDFSQSTGTVSIYYNPADNPAGSAVDPTSYTSPSDYSSSVTTNSAVANQLTAYMLVNTVNDLQNVENNLYGDYALGGNIDASSTLNWNAGAGFVPLGGPGDNFEGIFDGRGHTISRLTIYLPAVNGVGLFGYTGPSAVIRNLALSNVAITGLEAVGAVAGFNQGKISNVSVSGSVAAPLSGTANGFAVGGLTGLNYNSGQIDSASSSATVTGDSDVGGLVGENLGAITRSDATASTSGDDSQIGGLVGVNSGSITQSYSTGTVTDTSSQGFGVGGLVGWNLQGSIADSYSLAAVVGTSSAVAGGLVGRNFGSVATSYAAGPVSSGPNSTVGGLIGQEGTGGSVTSSYWDIDTSGVSTSAGGTAETTAQLKGGLPSGFDPAIWASDPNINNGYPYLKANPPTPAGPVTPTVVNFGTGITPPPSPWVTVESWTVAGPTGKGTYGAPMGTLTLDVNGVTKTLTAYSNGAFQGTLLGTYQCVQLIVRYAQLLGFPSSSALKKLAAQNGNMSALDFANASNKTFTYVSDKTAASLPIPGSVLSIAGWSTDPAGHVGIVERVVMVDATHATAYLFDQNIANQNVNGWLQVHFTLTNGVWVGTINITTLSGKKITASVVGWAQPVTG